MVTLTQHFSASHGESTPPSRMFSSSTTYGSYRFLLLPMLCYILAPYAGLIWL